VSALLRQVREQVPQVRPGVADPAGLGGEPEQRLHDREGHQFGVAELRGQAGGRLGDAHFEGTSEIQRMIIGRAVAGLDVRDRHQP
jgi:hypothetical protein